MINALPLQAQKGRGAVSNASGRFEATTTVAVDDGWQAEHHRPALRTTVTDERPKTVITRNQSPDVPFDRSLNPYRGCEHGCVYCFARPTHAYQGLSPGLDFESRLFAKPDAPEILEQQLRKPGYKPATLAMGTNTDPYQPIERSREITRGVLDVLDRFNHPTAIVTKSDLILRDLDILSNMAARGLVSVALSVTTLDRALARRMEPRAASPTKRLHAVRALADAGVPVSVMVAPIIPAINDHEVENILAAAAGSGAAGADYILLRLPGEVKALFSEWLGRHYPDRANKALALMADHIGNPKSGQLYNAAWGRRMRGDGAYAALLAKRFAIACRQLGLNQKAAREYRHRTDIFSPPPLPPKAGDQLSLF
ncbi:MAG: PA0069 family radical SAM protein [Rhodospirillaceae bacterium]|jgi:DNA repair photolyase|nr:PA0069 family radical SAM protein [Rhodospirillaceae bacterium]